MPSISTRACGAISIVLLLVLGLTAGASAQSVQDFSHIQASPISVTPDPGGRSAILEVGTSIDVACSVVYGEDATFGSIAVDNDMDGGAHADHHPVMGGLQPDTEYRYRVQGTAPDGAIYVSEVLSFRTPPRPVGGPPDLALEARVSGVSSEWSEAFGAGNAFDGDSSTEWATRGDGDDAWVEIDLGSPQAVDTVTFLTRSMSDGTATTTRFSITADGTLQGPYPVDEPVSSLDIVARVLRFDVDSSSGGNTGAVEISVLGPEATP